MIDTEYEINVADQFVAADNDAIFKCQVAPQARELYAIVGWLENGQQLVSAAAPTAQAHSHSHSHSQGGLGGGGGAAPVAAAGRRQHPQQQQQQPAAAAQQHSARATMLADGSLYIHRVRLRDANKSYRCQVRNLLNARVSASALSGRLFVTGE